MSPLYKHKVRGAPSRISIKIIYCTSLTVGEKQKAEYNTLQIIAQVCTLFLIHIIVVYVLTYINYTVAALFLNILSHGRGERDHAQVAHNNAHL